MKISFEYKPNFTHHWCGLDGSADAFIITELAKKQPQPILCMTEHIKKANHLYQNLQFFAPQLNIAYFLDWEMQPYDPIAPNIHIVSDRLHVLYRMRQKTPDIIVVALPTLIQAMCPPQFISAHIWQLKKGQQVEIESLLKPLQSSGYFCVKTVQNPGEFALKGEMLDLFPVSSKKAFRVVWDDNLIESIHHLDVENNQTRKAVDEINILPTKEYPTQKNDINILLNNYQTQFPKQAALFKKRVQKQTAGLQNYLPLFFNQKYNLIDHLPKQSIILYPHNLQQTITKYWEKIDEHYQQQADNAYPSLPPKALFFSQSELFSQLKQFSTIQISDTANKNSHNFKLENPQPIFYSLHHTQHLSELKNQIQATQKPTLISAHTQGRAHTLIQMLASVDIKAKKIKSIDQISPKTVSIIIGQLFESAYLPQVWIISENELFNTSFTPLNKKTQQAQQAQKIAKLNCLENLNIDDPVVYEKYGVGLFKGLITLDTHASSGEMICIEYADGDKAYINIDQIDQISPYQGEGDVQLHKMGSKLWDKTKDKIQKQAQDHAAKLLNVYAKRASKKGFSFTVTPTEYAKFAAQFPYEETPDQLQAIQNIITDMQSEQPTERLICGDVGFGKTEIAMRAAFIAISNQKQVVVLAPTTLLAQQHYKTFQDRFATLDARVCVLSRLNTTTANTLESIKKGEAHIIIGTHKILQKNMQFHEVGLLIIDEEHRFGVHQKEHIRATYPQVDTLLMSATPIPRTLNLAINGLYELSLIGTPPKKRLPIQTELINWDETKLTNIIECEIHRGGQLFFIEQRIEKLEDIAKYLAKQFPNISVAFAHGQMPKHQLEGIMSDFYQQQIDILVSTTIVEIGLDIPNANTIIIQNAQNFGLAQLHQLRGRVGRAHHQAYAYLITPPIKHLNTDGRRRLNAIKRLTQLGIGLSLATEDLEIRGGGDVLGHHQSGQIQKIGFHLYYQILKKTANAIQAGESFDTLWASDQQTLTIELDQATLIPEDYIFDIHERLLFYRHIAQATTQADLAQVEENLINQFGKTPPPVDALLIKTRLKQILPPYKVRSIQYETNQSIILTFKPNAPIDRNKLIQLLGTSKNNYQMQDPSSLKINKPFENLTQSIQLITHTLKTIATNKNAIH